MIAAGFIFAQWKKISLSSVTEIIVYLAAPSPVLTSLVGKPLYRGDLAILVLSIPLVLWLIL